MSSSSNTVATERRGWGARFLDACSSLKTSLTLLVLIVVYAAPGSAYPPFRQYFELSEPAYFHHAIFGSLVVLLCVAMLIATFRRVKFNRVTAGIYITHGGILLLCVGGLLYFGLKVEGDLQLMPPQILVLSKSRLESEGPARAVLQKITAAEGKRWKTNMPANGGAYELTVDKVRHNGLQTGFETTFTVRHNNESPRTLTLRQGAVNEQSIELDQFLVLVLIPGTTADEFYDMDRTEIRVRTADGKEGHFEAVGLPRYAERFVSLPDQLPILSEDGAPVTSARLSSIPILDAWRMPIPLSVEENADADVKQWPIRLTVDGYLPYADMMPSAVDGGEAAAFNPLAQVAVTISGEQFPTDLFGKHTGRSRDELTDQIALEFNWLADDNIPQDWTRQLTGSHILEVTVADAGITRSYDVSSNQTISVDGADYLLHIDSVIPSWPLMSPGYEDAKSPTLMVSVRGRDKSYQRTVIERFPQLSQDVTFDAEGKPFRHKDGPYDPNLTLRYFNASMHHARIVAGPNLAPVLIHTAPQGKRSVIALTAGKPVELAPALEVTFKALLKNPTFEMRPLVTPKWRRTQLMGRDLRRPSLVRVRIEQPDKNWSRHVWVPFTDYPRGRQRHAIPVDVPDFGPIELVHTSVAYKLPGTVAMEQMKAEFDPGMSVTDWNSHIRVQYKDESDVYGGHVHVNHTFRFGNWVFFQSGAALDHESSTTLGVGNREGIMTMSLGCILVTLGLLYTFYMKPYLKARLKEHYQKEAESRTAPAHVAAGVGSVSSATKLMCIAAAMTLSATQSLAQQPSGQAVDPHAGHAHAQPAGNNAAAAGASAAPAMNRDQLRSSLEKMALELQIDSFRLLAVQRQGRYQTVEAWARAQNEAITHGKLKLAQVDPVVEALEILFNNEAYMAENVIYIKDIPVRLLVTTEPVRVSGDERARIQSDGFVSADYMRRPAVLQKLEQFGSKTIHQTAHSRTQLGLVSFVEPERFLRFVPDPSGKYDAEWHTLADIFANTQMPGVMEHASSPPVDGITQAQSIGVLQAFYRAKEAWQQRDAAGVNLELGNLARLLPEIAPPGTYMSMQQRELEAFYTRAKLTTWSWRIYLAAALAMAFAVSSRLRAARWFATFLFIAAVGCNAWSFGLRWYILGRIPVANMYEALVGSALGAALLAWGLEWRLLRPMQIIYLLLICAAVVIQQEFDQSSFYFAWMIIASAAILGLLADMTYVRIRQSRRDRLTGSSAPGLPGIFMLAAAAMGFLALILADSVGGDLGSIRRILDDVLLRIHTVLIIVSYQLVTLAFVVANVYLLMRAWNRGTLTAWVMIGAELGATAALFYLKRMEYLSSNLIRETILYVTLGTIAGSIVGYFFGLIRSGTRSRTVSLPGATGLISGGAIHRRHVDTARETAADRAQLTLLNMANVGLFVGVILGAVWADYSWGRPWGWDAKEVFAMNTWLVYAILIHVRLMVRDKGLWTAVTACIGFGMMMFNWWAVNFFIVGLHSYA